MLKRFGFAKKPIIRIAIITAILAPIIIGLLSRNPQGTSFSGNFHSVDNFHFIYDLSYQFEGATKRNHRILDETLELIDEAEDYLILDLFLFNDEYNSGTLYPPSVKRLADALIIKKQKYPRMPIILITDPINNFYGVYEQNHITRLKDAGVDVIITDLDDMKDSNPIYSGYYRCYLQWFSPKGGGWITNFFDKSAEKVNIRSILKLANLKANHRKVVLSEKEAIVSSANPHDASSYHSNIAVRFSGNAIHDILKTELSVIDFSGGSLPDIQNEKDNIKENGSSLIRVITEEAIFNALLNNIESADKTDEIWLGIFYISDFDILSALGKAADRGVSVKIIADPNKDAFGIEKNGSPNRAALCELYEKHENVKVRWYNTQGEQYHSKAALFNYKELNKMRVILGSANFTRRNIKGYNLESDVEIIMPSDCSQATEIYNYFTTLWHNANGSYTLPIEAYYEDDFLPRVLWKVQEFTGLCSW